MKSYEELITGFCKQLQFNINELYKDGNHMIKYPVEFKHTHFRVGNTGYVFEATIRVSHIVIFKEYYHYEDDVKERDEAENIVYERLLASTFCYGVMASKKAMENFEKKEV